MSSLNREYYAYSLIYIFFFLFVVFFCDNMTIDYIRWLALLAVTIIMMKSTKVQTLGGIWRKYWIENTFACICITHL